MTNVMRRMRFSGLHAMVAEMRYVGGMPLVTLDRVSIAYGHLPLLDEVALQIDARERVSVIGRNGTGKSTLLKILSGEIAPDAGTVWRQPSLRVARLEQDVPLSAHRSVFDVVAEGHTHHLEEDEAWLREHHVELILSRLELPADAIVDTLSGGWRRRVLLARALVGQPDLLLLDEPTNHLDIEAIQWLESFLAEYEGAVMFVTHDRAFLQRLATRIIELDRGTADLVARQLRDLPAAQGGGARQRAGAGRTSSTRSSPKKKCGCARGSRRGGRGTKGASRRSRRCAPSARRAASRWATSACRWSRRSSPASWCSRRRASRKGFAGAPVIRDFSTRVIRGDRIGLIGPNGAGKTTLLRMLLGELKPDAGEIRLGANVQIAYYDQQREQLDPERTVFDTVGEGNDTVTSNGRTRHVHAYLRDFLFSDERARSPVKALSGGERNRLLLARLFTRPANVLVLDEPTNDLDLETLELLEEQLVEWPGTLLLVSHDRAFLDNVVTSTFVFEGDGRVQEYVGGYEDWVRQRLAEKSADDPAGGARRRRRAREARRRKAEDDQDRRAGAGSCRSRSSASSTRCRRRSTRSSGAARAGGTDCRRPSSTRRAPRAIKQALARAEELQRELAAASTRAGASSTRRK